MAAESDAILQNVKILGTNSLKLELQQLELQLQLQQLELQLQLQTTQTRTCKKLFFIY